MLLRPLFAVLRPAALADTEQEGAGDPSSGANGLVDSLFADELAAAFARAGGIGLARELERSFGPAAR
jgi:hypothetical protein